MSDGECDVHRIPRQKRGLLQTLGHVPTEGIEDDFASQVPVLSSLKTTITFRKSRHFLAAGSCGNTGGFGQRRQRRDCLGSEFERMEFSRSSRGAACSGRLRSRA